MNKMLRNLIASSILLVSGSTMASTIIGLTGEGLGAGSGGFGNSLSFSNGGINVDLSGYAETGTLVSSSPNFYLFETAEVYSWGSGIGICNRAEGSVAYGGCSNNEHEVDTVGRDDLLVFVFDQAVNFEELTVDPYNGPGDDPHDRNITYWVGNAPLPDLTAHTFASLDGLFGTGVESGADASFQPYTHTLYGSGNILLLAGDVLRNDRRGCRNEATYKENECEAYKIQSIRVSAVPLPASAWLFITALAGLTMRMRAKP